MVTGCLPAAQPPTWRASQPYLLPRVRVAQLYPRHRVPILVAFYDLHGLQWNCSFSWSPHREFVGLIEENKLDKNARNEQL